MQKIGNSYNAEDSCPGPVSTELMVLTKGCCIITVSTVIFVNIYINPHGMRSVIICDTPLTDTCFFYSDMQPTNWPSGSC